MSRTGSFLTALMLAFASVMACATPAFAQNFRNADLYLIHGLPGNELDNAMLMLDFPNDLPVDILVGLPGTGTLNVFYTNVILGDIKGPLTLTVGTYQVEFRQANAMTPGSGALIASNTVAVRSGENHTAILHETTARTPTVTAYNNDDSRISTTSARVVFRHDALIGPVDMSLASAVGLPGIAAPNLTNPNSSAVFNLATGPYVLYVKAAAQTTDLVTPIPVFLSPRNEYIYYLVGSTDRSTLRVISQSFPLKPKLLP